MKQILKNILVNSFAIYITSLIFSGLIIKNGLSTLLIGGLLLAVISTILKPIVGIITLPFNLISFGLFSFITTLVSLLLITYFYNNIRISGFEFSGVSLWGFEIKRIFLSQILSFIVISATIYLINKAIYWLFSK